MKYLLTLTLFLILPIELLFADDWKEILNLRGYWKFNIGDDKSWANTEFNDEDWDNIKVPSSWEDEGYHGYNGFAWYRKSFTLPKNINSNSLYLVLGFIDDVDEVYLNGKLVGSTGSFPPDFRTAYNANRKYPVSIDQFNKKGENIIAIRIYDSQLSGGIIYGDISIMILDMINMDLKLDGHWKFNIGDNLVWKEPNFNDKEWTNILVPSNWESQGYKDYDGFAWYRKKFYLDKSFKDKDLVLLLGKIDDIDQCFVNGTMIGNTGDFLITPETNVFNNEWLAQRGYYLPKEILKYGEENLIAVRVYDGYIDGGIYQGPIGLTTQKVYREYWKDKKSKKGFWETFFDDIMQ
ncbi:MAG: beta galactosidase jelly roll domain-containing protein [Ignavibacteriae bacterium]|nr:beta galactosidase jelly roll domain-containing protein [Ignavibacteriota bacterium]MCB9209467.1 beta galactosidase jelly roll domain-containing protein [Ignavibacteriales bacterium]MCB9258110.1 beta galactosidase jelly roll domain-containing protein [Ignavibacteriales bacterium]